MTIRAGFLLLAAAVNLAAAVGALWRRAVSRDGALAGFLVGTIILYAGGFFFWAMLMLFFVSSTVVSRIGRRAKASLEQIHEKGARRDAMQVLANGGAGLVAVVLFGLTREPALAVAGAAGFAAVNADTWASELGVLSSRAPRSIIGGAPLPAGASGGVTAAGTLASLGGGALIGTWFMAGLWLQQSAAAGLPLTAASPHPATGFLVVTLAGALGSVVDSVLGATLQAQYRTPDGAFTERRETAGRANTLVRGRRSVTNDAVNFLSSCAAAVTAGLTAALIG